MCAPPLMGPEGPSARPQVNQINQRHMQRVQAPCSAAKRQGTCRGLETWWFYDLFRYSSHNTGCYRRAVQNPPEAHGIPLCDCHGCVCPDDAPTMRFVSQIRNFKRFRQTIQQQGCGLCSMRAPCRPHRYRHQNGTTPCNQT